MAVKIIFIFHALRAKGWFGMCMSVCARTRGCLSHSVVLNPL